MTKKLGGILAAVSTPFAADGSVDEGRLRAHVDFLIDNGLHGLVPGGSTGEFAALTADERKFVNKVVIDQAAGRVPVAPQTGSTSTAEAIALSKQAAADGADAILLVQPYYEAPTRREVIEYFATVGEAAGVPVIAYNLPGVTGMNLDRPFYRELLERTSAVQYVKDTSGSIEQAFDLIFNLGDAIDTFVGWDTIVLPAFSAGAAGSIWGAPNFAPKECVAIYDLAKAGKTAEAFDIFKRLWNVFDFLGKEGYAVSTKAAAQAVGVDLGAPRAPYGELEPEKLDELRKLVAETGLNYS
ncbi:dihydrodipicolinate synthase family protein [Mycolicibacterium sp. BiH015]|uniref:dihydrodipicolinate synthase family protein n=1 Tax=Mycolicibacterium sp. BiH015 TaxID=3018808 RepID=UPI0022E46D8E|nr:dihydrodipicolinate synthase family protein [Mycolicibacterium sp. BiH015]MDA2893288.1 dihydrodipicolinate synthase family protein [Mycolicibacterium sp. BiH015]